MNKKLGTGKSGIVVRTGVKAGGYEPPSTIGGSGCAATGVERRGHQRPAQPRRSSRLTADRRKTVVFVRLSPFS